MQRPDPRIVWYRGAWAALFYDDDGRRQRRSLGTDDRAIAEARFGEWKRLRGQPLGVVTVGEIVAGYIGDKERTINRPDRLRDAWKALELVFKHKAPRHITEDDCRAYRQRRNDLGRSDGTVHVELGMLRAALRWGVRKKWLDQAPYIWLPQKPPPRDRVLTKAEIDRLEDAAVMPHVKLFVQLLRHTACRAGAALDLTWGRVDFDRNRIDFYNPKRTRTKKGRPTVPMNRSLREVLAFAKEGAMTDHVIEWAGKPVASLKKGFAAAVMRADVAPCSPHVLRHSAAVIMAEAGVPMPEIAQYMGHTDSRLTERVYARYSPDYLSGAAAALER